MHYHTFITSEDIVLDLKDKFGIKSCCIVMDRGMVTENNLTQIEGNGFIFLVILSRTQIYKYIN